MKLTPLVFAAVLLLAVAAWAAAQEPAPAVEPVVVTAAATPEEEAAVAQLVAMLPTIQPLDTSCINCHQDAELLQQLAEEPEVVEKLSEGSG
ncbi:MAG: hypothetical protein DWB42_14475 [Chloroflexi bacterium]|nr:hypothetical protein [Chloroflexota bacterium]MDL1883849.1 hypothetical protein [Anaerolineae bacterium CFX8]GIL11464.1 MAG: hypothetical protein BroJett038_01840 [Chloroflexota bacterium]